jgi:hypothetical protein
VARTLLQALRLQLDQREARFSPAREFRGERRLVLKQLDQSCPGSRELAGAMKHSGDIE